MSKNDATEAWTPETAAKVDRKLRRATERAYRLVRDQSRAWARAGHTAAAARLHQRFRETKPQAHQVEHDFSFVAEAQVWFDAGFYARAEARLREGVKTQNEDPLRGTKPTSRPDACLARLLHHLGATTKRKRCGPTTCRTKRTGHRGTRGRSLRSETPLPTP